MPKHDPLKLHKKTIIQRIERMFSVTILDTLFPRNCLGCGVYYTWLCDGCHGLFALLPEQHCPLCTKHVTPDGQACFSCNTMDPLSIDGVYVVSAHDALMKKVVHMYKYHFVKDLSEPLALLLAQGLRHSHLRTPDMIIPVPLHHRRLRWRGFNQAQELAIHLDLKIPIDSTSLVRTRYTSAQAKISGRSLRRENLVDAFAVTQDIGEHAVRGKDILLIDDITTTSTTLIECARALKKAGAHRVTGLVLARE